MANEEKYIKFFNENVNEDIDDIHNEIAHLEEKWEKLLEE